MDHGSSFAAYMSAKIEKLRLQMNRDRRELGIDEPTTLFRDVCLHVNGNTRPNAQELKILMLQHGGMIENYYRSSVVTHIVATNLPDVKLKQLAAMRSPPEVVTPAWVVDSIEARRRLPLGPYRLRTALEGDPRARHNHNDNRSNSHRIASRRNRGGLGKGTEARRDGRFLTPQRLDEKDREEEEEEEEEYIDEDEEVHDKDRDRVYHRRALMTEDTRLADEAGGREADEDEDECDDERQICMDTDTDTDMDMDMDMEQARGFGLDTDLDTDLDVRGTSRPVPSLRPSPEPRPSPRPDRRGEAQYAVALATTRAARLSLENQSARKGDTTPTTDIPITATHNTTTTATTTTTITTTGRGRRSTVRASYADPAFVASFKNASRLHFIGSWKSRAEAIAAKMSPSDWGPDPIYPNSHSHSHSKSESESNAKTYLHVDLDCFFAAVAVRDYPVLRGWPVAVSHATVERGHRGTSDISSATYEARAYGICAGMWSGQALRCCPHLILMPYDFAAYTIAGEAFLRTCARHASAMEPLSCDEVVLDITGLSADHHHGSGSNGGSGSGSNPRPNPHPNPNPNPNALEFAQRLREAISAATGGLTASCGIGPTKLTARVATRRAKPDGIFMFKDLDEAVASMGPESVGTLPGIGRRTVSKLAAIGVHTCADVARRSDEELNQCLGGTAGYRLRCMARGRDPGGGAGDREVAGARNEGLGTGTTTPTPATKGGDNNNVVDDGRGGRDGHAPFRDRHEGDQGRYHDPHPHPVFHTQKTHTHTE